jgi:hypothetical protein
MSAPTTSSVQPAKPIQDVRTAESTPVLITEQEVAFSTAAAIPAAPTTPRWLRMLRGLFATDSYSHGRSQPRRYSFLERSCMARAMDRL